MSRPSKLWGPYSHPNRKAPYVRNDPSVIYGQPAVSGEAREQAILKTIADIETLKPGDTVLEALSPETRSRFQPLHEYDHLRGVYTDDQGNNTEICAMQPVVKEACKDKYKGQIVLTRDLLLKRLPPGYPDSKQSGQRGLSRRPPASRNSTGSTRSTLGSGSRLTPNAEKRQTFAPLSTRRHRFLPRNAANRIVTTFTSNRPTIQRMHSIAIESML